MAKNYRDNFDYSEAIANSTSKAERDRLLAERQNKIDAEGLTGKVADNSAVSTWTSSYRPYYVASSSSASKAASENAERVSSLYDAAEKARLQRFEAARTRIRQQLSSNLSSIDSDYAAAVRQADISARQSALRNEEKLALLGLNMGAKTGAATSGAAETSRIAVDNQYRGDLASLAQTRLTARASAESAAAASEADAENSYTGAAENAAMSQAQTLLNQYNAERDYSLSMAGLTGFLDGVPTLSYRNYELSAAAARAEQSNALAKLRTATEAEAYERALARWKTTGYVQKGDAAVLGVPAGTPTADVSYKNASLALQKWKAGYRN